MKKTTKEKKSAKVTKTIGSKVITLMAGLAVVFLVAVIADIMALSAIRKNNDTINVYLEMSQTKSEVSTAFQQAQLYANLCYFKQTKTDEIDIMRQKLGTSISDVTTAMDTLGTLCAETGDAELVASYDSWYAAMGEFMEYCQEILDASEAEDFDTAGAMVDDLKPHKEPAQEAEDVYDALVAEKQAAIQSASSTKIIRTCELNIVLLVLFLAVLGVTIAVVIVTVANPAKKSGTMLQQIVDNIENNEGDLTARIPVNTQDEIGQMTAGINGFLEQLQGVMQRLKVESENMMASAETVGRKISESNMSATSVSAAMEEMSASMEEISATLGQMASGSSNVLEEVKGMSGRVNGGVDLVGDIKVRAQSMHQSTVESQESTGQTIVDIREKLMEAVQASRSVEQINELTGEILSITSQTNLLALNASIEAARAGEAGKGFAVVADEIRMLADSSRDTANNIQNISNKVTESVGQLAASAEEMVQFIDEKVMKDYDGFVDVAEQYEKDARSIEDILSEFAKSAEDINETIQSMNEGINDIAIAVDESAKGVTSVAENTVNLVTSITQIQEETENNQMISSKLSGEVNRFKRV